MIEEKTIGFEWCLEVVNADGTVASRDIQQNLIPTDGLDFLLRSPFGDVSTVSRFYLGLYRGNYIPSPGAKSSDIPGNMLEFVDYAESTRPEWRRAHTGPGSLDNIGDKAEYTVTQDRTLYGAFLVSDNIKGEGNGLLLSCVRWPSPKEVTTGQTIRLSGGLTYTSSSII